ncbi:MAG: hypothetical protein JW772_03320 [Candidatus Diapherotrites archaeon]|nr:hypothetical protein [Candidatus Diapherotrites archaeon]
MQDEISEVNYKIGRENIELRNLEKRLEKKKKIKILDSDEETDLLRAIAQKKAVIAGLEREIRRIENTAVRKENLKR